MAQFELPVPADGPARHRSRGADDPVLPHLIWEALLLLGVVVCFVVLMLSSRDSSTTQALRMVLLNAAIGGLLASGIAVSMRTAAPNLAAGMTAIAIGVLVAKLADATDWSMMVIAPLAVVVAILINAVLGGVTLALSVPAWAVTFGGAVLIQGVMLSVTHGDQLQLPDRTNPSPWLWFPVFAVITLGGGALWRIRGLRGWLGAGRRTGDPAAWRLAPGIGALVGLSVSGLLAGLAGVLQVNYLAVAGSSDTLLAPALGAVLLGGVSIFGRRAGIAGTLFAVLILSAIAMILVLNGVSATVNAVVIGVAIVLGLGVSRLLELLAGLFSRGRQPRLATAPAPSLGTLPPPGPRTHSPQAGPPPAGPLPAGPLPAGPLPARQPEAGPPWAPQPPAGTRRPEPPSEPPPADPPPTNLPPTNPPPAGPGR